MKIYLDTIGCRLNQAEIEQFARQFHAAGHSLVPTPEEADLAVVNTCLVTSAAASDSRQKIRKLARAGVDEIVATGCWATLKPQEAASLPKVNKVIRNCDKDSLVPNLLQIPEGSFDLEPIERQPVPGARQRTRAFIKVQDGCDNRCTFCITTLARGSSRSRSISEVLADIRAASQVKEIVLTGVHLGAWGQDLSPALNLCDLVQEILASSDIPRLRLSSLEPWDLEPDFFQLWQNPRLCRHLHLPLQSGSAGVLKRMARKTTPEDYANLVLSARKAIPGIAISTDVITGFPGESEDEFEESLLFIRQMNFANGHVFTYSARQGTAAARMLDQVPHTIRKERNARMRAVFAESAHAFQAAYLGQVMDVLWESATAFGPGGWEISGLTGNYLRVKTQAPKKLTNQISPVLLTGLGEQGIQGQIQS